MNRPQEMLRQQGMSQLGQVPLNAAHFMQNPQQPGQQQQQPGARMGFHQNSNPNTSILSNGQPNNTASQLSSAQIQLGMHRRQQMMMQQSQNAQMNGSAPPQSVPQMGVPGHTPLSNMSFPNGMMQQGAGGPLRRVASHPQSLNQQGGHAGGMHPSQQGVGGLNMSMNPQANIPLPAQIRQAQQQQQQQQQQTQMGLRMQQQLHGQMSPDITMTLGRQGNNGMPQNTIRAPSSQAQLMASLSQPSSGNVQPPLSLPQNSFQHSMPHQPSSIPSSSPRPVNHAQNHNPPGMPMGTPGSSQGSGPRSQLNSENVMFMNFQNQQFPPNRMPATNNQFSFSSSGSPSQQQMDMQQSLNGAPLNAPNASNRPGFQTTPAQQYEQMQQNDNFSPHFNMPPPQANPPRPPSHPNSHHGNPLPRQSQQSLQHSPHPSDHMINHMPQPPRPQSQPQTQPGRPPSQAGPSHTPRSSQAQLTPGSANLSQARIPTAPQPQPSPHQPPHPVQAQPQIAPRPPPPVPTATPSGPPQSNVPTAEGALRQQQSQSQQQVPQNLLTLPIGVGQGLIRLLQFSGVLSGENNMKLQLSYWDSLVKEYFMPRATMKLTLWKDNQKTEARPFDIGVPILPRFFLVTTQSGVKSMTLSLDGARERLVAPGHAVVECVTAVWTYKYNNGYTVTLRGPLTAHVLLIPGPQPTSSQLPYTLKFDNLEFNANLHDKFIALDSLAGQRVFESPKTPRTRNASTPSMNGSSSSEDDKKWDEPRVIIEHASIPGEPVNAFGIPQATMRCLELAESVGQMTELIAFSNEARLGPIEALNKFAANLKESGITITQQGTLSNSMPNGVGPGSFQGFPGMNGLASAPAVTLSAGPSNTQILSSTNSPQNNHLSIDTPQKQKGSTQGQGSGSAPPQINTSSGPSSSTNTTPSLGHATLKRKPNDSNSPTTSNTDQPPSKRPTRKRPTRA